MRFLHEEDKKKELTYEDVFLVPQYSEIDSRMDVDLRPQSGIGMTVPVIVANMNAVAGRRMTETVTRRGGLVVLHQDTSFERVKQIVSYVKSCHHVFETPVMLEMDESVQTALNLIHKRAHGAVIIVDKNQRPVGIFTPADAKRRDRFVSLKNVMTTGLVTVSETQTPRNIFDTLHQRRLSIAPVVDRDGILRGVMTKQGALRAKIYTPATNDRNELLTAAAVAFNRDLENSIKRMLNIGVDVIVLDTAHGHQKHMLAAIRKARRILGPQRPLAAGNIVTVKAARDFIDAGANILKVGVGPGAMCTTRMMTGMGRPQLSAVMEVSGFSRKHGVHVWADGGIRHPRDVAIALAAGADSAFIGSWFAGTYESPADIQKDSEGRMYKENYGSASSRAVVDRTRKDGAFVRARKQYFDEGISTSRMYLKSGEESAEDIIDKISAGVRSACAYAGAGTLKQFYERAVLGTQTPAGYTEGLPVRKR